MKSSADEMYRQALSARRAGDAEGAERKFRRTLELQPRHVGALNSYGILLVERGRYKHAEQYLKKALMIDGKFEIALFNYGLILRALNRPLEALEQFSRALALNASAAETWSNRGAVHLDLDRPREAIADLDRAIVLDPKFPDAFFNKGRALTALRIYEPALAAFDQALAVQPHLAPAWVGRGYALYSLGRFEQALAAFDRALELQPGLAGAWVGRGTIPADNKGHDGALPAFDTALALQADKAWLGRGRVLFELRRYDEAINAYERALALNPNLARAYVNMGHALADSGELEKARDAFLRAIKIDPNVGDSYFYLAESKRFNSTDPDLAAMEALAANTARLSKHDRMFLDFALGKAYADTKDYRRSFQHLLAGNAARRSMVRYDEAVQFSFFDRIEETLSRDVIAAKTAFGDASSRPIFVLGMPRSGSTLVEQVLASHPDVESAGELTAFGDAVRSVRGPDGNKVPYPDFVSTIDEPTIRFIAEQYLGQLARLAPRGRRVVDKLPGNFIFAGLIHIVFQNAIIIHTVRDPVDTCVSCFSTLFKNGIDYGYDLGELGRYYVRYRRLMEHWRRVLPPARILDVRYEDVVADLAGQACRILAHCGLPWDDRCLAFHQTKRTIRTSSRYQVRQPIYDSAVGRWRAYAEFLTPLLVELGMDTPPSSSLR